MKKRNLYVICSSTLLLAAVVFNFTFANHLKHRKLNRGSYPINCYCNGIHNCTSNIAVTWCSATSSLTPGACHEDDFRCE